MALALCVCSGRDCLAQTQAHACTLRVHVDGLRNQKGVVGALVFTSPAGWPENVSRSFRGESTSIDPGRRDATVVIQHVPPGDYGIVVLHDENRNMKLDRNLFGFPKEGFGFSNNPHIGLGPPPYAKAVMRISCPTTDTTIHIIYK